MDHKEAKKLYGNNESIILNIHTDKWELKMNIWAIIDQYGDIKHKEIMVNDLIGMLKGMSR